MEIPDTDNINRTNRTYPQILELTSNRKTNHHELRVVRRDTDLVVSTGCYRR